MIGWREIIVVDTETSGPNPFVHDILSLAMVPLDRSRPELNLHVTKAGAVSWNQFARENFENFRSTWTWDAVDVRVAAITIKKYLEAMSADAQLMFAGHNVSFDRAFLQKLEHLSGIDVFRCVSHRTLDTHSLIYDRVLKGELPDTCLTSDGMFRYFGVQPAEGERHTAFADASATRDVLEKILGYPAQGRSSHRYSRNPGGR